MIDYNPEQHYDIVLESLVKDLFQFTQKYDVSPTNIICDTDKAVCHSVGKDIYRIPYPQFYSLQVDAMHEHYRRYIELLSKTDQEPNSAFSSNGNSQYEPELDGMSKAFFDWKHQPSEEGLVLTKGDKQLLMTSKPYWNK